MAWTTLHSDARKEIRPPAPVLIALRADTGGGVERAPGLAERIEVESHQRVGTNGGNARRVDIPPGGSHKADARVRSGRRDESRAGQHRTRSVPFGAHLPLGSARLGGERERREQQRREGLTNHAAGVRTRSRQRATV